MLTKKKKSFDKGYTQIWTEEVFKISKIQLTIPVTYKITDYNAEEIQGSFYEQELQKTKQDIFRIEKKIIKQLGNKSLVKWLGYNDSFNSWVVWPGFHKFSQVIMLYDIYFIKHYLFF